MSVGFGTTRGVSIHGESWDVPPAGEGATARTALCRGEAEGMGTHRRRSRYTRHLHGHIALRAHVDNLPHKYSSSFSHLLSMDSLFCRFF